MAPVIEMGKLGSCSRVSTAGTSTHITKKCKENVNCEQIAKSKPRGGL